MQGIVKVESVVPEFRAVVQEIDLREDDERFGFVIPVGSCMSGQLPSTSESLHVFLSEN
jgi:hypothetical protein